jgi:hypothetical protein
MVIQLEGDIYKVGKTKKGGNFLNILVKRPDGQSDSVTIFTDKEYRPGTKFKGTVNAYVQMASEV